jgi:predicted nuclease of predicted toxin-antitoxin system
MKIKLDENLPDQLAAMLQKLGHDAHTTPQQGLNGRADREIWEASQKESRFLVTQDLDFSDLRKFSPGSHFGILLVRLHFPSRKNLIERVGEIFRTETLSDWKGCFVVATERKIRIVKPPRK